MGHLHGVGRPPRGPLNWLAVKTSAKLSALFLLVYGTCNWITAHRSDVGTYYFEWERHIPFVPLMIVPYMSIDLFFIAAPFLCRTERERKTLSNRITGAILIAGAVFLILPLRFGFERPDADGVLGVIFNNFRKLDQPFNQFPSLHIALRTILALFYVEHTRGILRWLTRIWFTLIGVSTLLTYQHHLIDIIGGFALGVTCIYFWQDQHLKLPTLCNCRIGSYYLAGSILLCGAGILTRPIGFLLLWPAASCAIVTAAYFGIGPGIYRKRDGELPATTRLMLWPILLGQHVSLRYYARQCEPWNKLSDRIWIGRKLSDREAQQAIDLGVTAVIDLSGEFPEARPLRRLDYHLLPILDLTAPTSEHLEQAISFISERKSHGVVYIHCKAGYSRTAAVAGAFLLHEDETRTVDNVVQMLKSARPAMVIRPEVKQCLENFKKRMAPRQHVHPQACQKA